MVPPLLETVTRVIYRLGTFVYWSIAAICMALDYQSDLKDQEIRAAELERLLAEARLPRSGRSSIRTSCSTR